MVKSFDPKKLHIATLQSYLTASVAPRPICFASTVDKEGKVNLAPYSFFNAFSANPPMMVFSSNRSGRTGETKDTYKNIKEVPEVVVNIVSYKMAEQMSLASTAYPRGVNEFEKAGFTPVDSETIKPPRVKESPVAYECKVVKIDELGDQGGAGNLFFCEIQRIHIHESILNDEDKIDQLKIDVIGRAGYNNYVRVNKDSIFEIKKPLANLGMGVDQIPDSIRTSHILSANNLGQLGNFQSIPSKEECQEILVDFQPEDMDQCHQKAKDLLAQNNVSDAWKILMLPEYNLV